MRQGTVRTGWAVVLAAVIVVGCGGEPPAPAPPRPDPGDKTGGRSGPISIRVEDSQPANKPSNIPLAEFARQVATRSDGSMSVTVLADTPGDAMPATSDAAVIERVRGGELEMAVVPARAWSDAGVMSLRALQAPFLIESDEHAAAIVSDDSITTDLFSGLDGTGVTGLVLYPEGLRHLFGFGTPILTPADVADRKIRMIRSRDTDAIITAMGGSPIEAEFDAFAKGIEDGTIRGAESSFTLVDSFPELPIATGNVVPYAKVDSLVVNDGFWASLNDEQRRIVREAAVETRTWSIENLNPDADAAARYCAIGGSVELTDPGSVERFRAATSDVVAELAKDAMTGALMTRIRDAGEGLSQVPVKACAAPIARTIKPDGGDLPDGIYRIEYTDDYLKGWGVRDVNLQHGVWTYRLEDGHWTIDQRADDMTDHISGIYQVKGRDLYWRWDNDPGAPIDHLAWSVAPDGDLTFAAVGESSEGWTFGLPLIRVGPLPD